MTARRADGLLSPAYRGLTIGTVALASMIAFEYLAVATAMPAVARDLRGLSLYALAFGGSLAAGVVGLVVGGMWSDASGPRRPTWHGVAWFVVGLLIAGLAPSMEVLVAGRMVQGFGGGLISVALYVVVGRCYPERLHPKMFGAFAAAWVIPSIVGPALTGVVVQALGWRWVFLAIPALALPAVALVRPALPSPAAAGIDLRDRRVRWALGAAVAAAVLHQGAQGRGTVAVVVAAIGLAGLVRFAPRLLPTGTARLARGLPSVIALRGVASAAFLQAEVFVPLMLTEQRGLTPAGAGLALTLAAISWSAASWYRGRDGLRWTSVDLLRVGMCLIATGVATVALVLVPSAPLPVAVAGWCLAGVGMGLVFPTLSVLTLELSPAEEQGSNSSALQLCDSLFAASAIAVGGPIFAALVGRSAPLAFAVVLSVSFTLAVAGAAAAGRVSLQATPTNRSRRRLHVRR